jgi:hypothetical protein
MALGGMLLAGTASCVVAPVESEYVASPPAVVIHPHRHYHRYRYYRPYRPHRHYHAYPYRYYWPYRPSYGYPYGHRW